MKITRPEHKYAILFHEDGTIYLTVKAEDEIVELEGMKGYLYYYSECVDEEDIDASPKLTLKEMCDYARECFNDWSISTEAIEALISDLTSWFEKYAISDEEKVSNEIRELEERIEFRRKRIAGCVKNIDDCRQEISECEQRIGREVSEIAKINEDIEEMVRKIAKLRAAGEEEKFVSVDPEYTGGGIYVFTGELTDGNYFLAETSCYDVRILNANPNIPVEMSDDEAWEKYGVTRDEDAWASVEWQEEHLVKDLAPDEAVAFFKEMFKWIEDNKPNGNYLSSDMEYYRNEVESLKGDWR